MRKWLRLCLLAGCAASAWAVDWKAYRPQGFVNDFAGVVDASSKSQLERYCSEVDRLTGIPVLLLTIPSLHDEPLTDVAASFFDAWKDPRKPDRRVLVLLTVYDRHRYVAVGGGVPPAVADGLARRVLREMRPALRRSNYAEALKAAAETAGRAASKGAGVRLTVSLPRRLRWSPIDDVPWFAVIGAIIAIAVLMWFGAPAGYGAHGRGLIPALVARNRMNRTTWGGRGTGGFGAYDSGDECGAFGGATTGDW